MKLKNTNTYVPPRDINQIIGHFFRMNEKTGYLEPIEENPVIQDQGNNMVRSVSKVRHSNHN